MLQSSLLKLATLCVKQCNLLKLGVKICSYNDHCSAPFSRALVGLHHQIYSGVGADIVMESISPTIAISPTTPTTLMLLVRDLYPNAGWLVLLVAIQFSKRQKL